MGWYILLTAISFVGGCLVTANNPILTDMIRKLFGK